MHIAQIVPKSCAEYAKTRKWCDIRPLAVQ